MESIIFIVITKARREYLESVGNRGRMYWNQGSQRNVVLEDGEKGRRRRRRRRRRKKRKKKKKKRKKKKKERKKEEEETTQLQTATK